tara:strand:+ start:816 stop:1607 length:792 start_codon:yes stop_codon:yes gene_type:complete
MDKRVFQYAIVRFMPLIETEEFANIGIVAVCERTGRMAYKLQAKKYARITHFFEGIGQDLYLSSIRNLDAELTRLKNFANKENIKGLFEELVRPRETIMRFGEARFILGSELDTTVKELFEYYVGRNFVTKEYKEALMERRVKDILKVGHLETFYTKKTLSDGIYEATIPFVSINNSKALKPLHLAYEKPSQAIDHGMIWLNRIAELRRRKVLGDNVLFTVDKPDENTKVYSAYEDLLRRFEDEGIISVQFDDTEAVLEFAKN